MTSMAVDTTGPPLQIVETYECFPKFSDDWSRLHEFRMKTVGYTTFENHTCYRHFPSEQSHGECLVENILITQETVTVHLSDIPNAYPTSTTYEIRPQKDKLLIEEDEEMLKIRVFINDGKPIPRSGFSLTLRKKP